MHHEAGHACGACSPEANRNFFWSASIGNLIQLEQEYINPDKPQTDSVEALALIGPPAGANPILSIKPMAKQPALAGPRAKTARPQWNLIYCYLGSLIIKPWQLNIAHHHKGIFCWRTKRAGHNMPFGTCLWHGLNRPPFLPNSLALLQMEWQARATEPSWQFIREVRI
jgi:hypothetical protein